MKDDLGLKSWKRPTLADDQKAEQLKRIEAMKRRFAANRHRSIMFIDEKLFTIEVVRGFFFHFA
jgi:hypothetical protein